MIIDSHCHAWTRWPYQPPVPDDSQRGRIEQLLHEMDLHGVDRAAVCAQIEHNPDNNAYIAEQVQRYGERLYQLADVDCSWSPTYHRPGAARRLEQAAQRWPISGFTHYLRDDDDGAWLYGAEGRDFFGGGRAKADRKYRRPSRATGRHPACCRAVLDAADPVPPSGRLARGRRRCEPGAGAAIGAASQR